MTKENHILGLRVITFNPFKIELQKSYTWKIMMHRATESLSIYRLYTHDRHHLRTGATYDP